MASSVEVFHCNDRMRINKFVAEPDFLIISQHKFDELWAGRGMYFWDNKGNAKYWYKDSVKKSPDSSFLIAQANIHYDQETFMDLLDLEIEKLCQQIIDRYEALGVISNRDSLGKKIDFVASELNFKVVRVSGYYKNTPQTSYLKRSKVSNKNKIIYCVKGNSADIITERKVLGD